MPKGDWWSPVCLVIPCLPRYNRRLRSLLPLAALSVSVRTNGGILRSCLEVWLVSGPIIAAVGDLQLGDSPTTVGYGVYSRYGGGSLSALFGDAGPVFSRADLVFGNLETVLSPPPVGAHGRAALQLRGQPEFAADLKEAGFTVVNVANNHTAQHGEEAFRATVAALRVNGIACCGIRGSGDWVSKPATLVVAGQTISLVGYSLRPRQYGSEVPPYAEGSREGICRDVERLIAGGATVIVSLHWGEEFVPYPSRDEVELGHAIIDAGASLVLGHHPHVTRPVERYKSGLIAYSLGNFMGDMTWYAPFRQGTVLQCVIGPKRVTDVSLIPTQLGTDYRPKLGSPSSDMLIPEGQLVGLDAAEYERRIRATWRRQRIAAYVSAVVNLPRTPPRVFAQLAKDTLRNKFDGLRLRLRPRVGESQR